MKKYSSFIELIYKIELTSMLFDFIVFRDIPI
jgi:hypothetical protein